MVGADTVISAVLATLSVLVITFVGWVMVLLVDPLFNNVVDQSLFTSLGWGSPQDTVYLFATLAMIGLVFVVVIWWIARPIRNDVRQDTRPPGGPPF